MLTYFRVLKRRPPPPVLFPAVMEGLAKFVHLVNLDTVQDLLDLLKDLLTEVSGLYAGCLAVAGSSSGGPISSCGYRCRTVGNLGLVEKTVFQHDTSTAVCSTVNRCVPHRAYLADTIRQDHHSWCALPGCLPLAPASKIRK